MVNSPPSNGNTNDLYLKGTNYNTGQAIKWDDKVDYGGSGNQRRWDFNVFGSGGIRIDEQDGTNNWGTSADNLSCDIKGVFQVTRSTYSGGGKQWTDDASKIKFELKNCSNKSKGRQICDIEIEGEKKFILKPHSSLSFKSDVQNTAPSNGSANELHLKGQGYVGSDPVNFEETILGRGHRSGGENRWQLKVFKSGTTRLGELSGAEGGDYGDDNINCGKGWFIVEKPTYEDDGDWEKDVAKVTFKLENCTDIAKGRKECEIKIAEEKFILKKKISFLSL